VLKLNNIFIINKTNENHSINDINVFNDINKYKIIEVITPFSLKIGTLFQLI